MPEVELNPLESTALVQANTVARAHNASIAEVDERIAALEEQLHQLITQRGELVESREREMGRLIGYVNASAAVAIPLDLVGVRVGGAPGSLRVSWPALGAAPEPGPEILVEDAGEPELADEAPQAETAEAVG